MNGLRLFDIELYSVHGGSYRYFICKDSSDVHKNNYKNLNKFEEKEKHFGVDSYEILKERMEIINQNIIDIKNTLEKIKSEKS